MTHEDELGPDDAAKTRIAMQMGAEMHKAQEALVRPPAGEEAAELAGRAARAAVFGFIDMGRQDTPGMNFGLVQAISIQSYTLEWQRLMSIPREGWRA